MQITLSARTEELIERLITSGQAQTPVEAVDAMASFWADSMLEPGLTTDDLRELVQEALDDEAAGRVTVLRGTTELHQHRDELIQKLRDKHGSNASE